jgi:hypothetical protein
MGTYCFAGGCESKGWTLVFYSTKYMISATIYITSRKVNTLIVIFGLRIISIRPILISRRWFEDDVILPVGLHTWHV